MKSAALFPIVVLLVVFNLFQNCSEVQFAVDRTSLQSLSPEGGSSSPSSLACNTNKPFDSELILCPVDGGNRPLKNSIRRTREYYCVNGQWTPGEWQSAPISDCGCANSLLIPDPLTGLCQCPSGKVLSNGRCESPQCDPTQRQSTTERKICADGVHFATRARSETCNMSNTQWEYGSWSPWNYSQCTCSLAGQSMDSSGQCQCPPNKFPIGSSCGTCPDWQHYNSTTKTCVANSCDPANKPSSSESKACSYGAGVATRTCGVNCNTTTFNWERFNCTPWNYSACACPSGKVLNSTSGLCECATGTVDDGAGACKVTTCDPQLKPPTSSIDKCQGSGVSGTTTTTCSVSCETNPLRWVKGSCSTNTSGCSCPIAGQTYTAYGCVCPSGQDLILNSSGVLSCGQCGNGYRYDAVAKKCISACTQDEVLKATRSYFSTESLNSDEALALSCIDPVTPTLADNLPTDDPKLIRFFNTCGNRYCKMLNPLKGYIEGRVVERNNGLVLECRKTAPPPEITDSCRQKLLSLPPSIVGEEVEDGRLDNLCADSVVPVGQSLPESSDGVARDLKQVRWIFTCSSRFCRSLGKGYTSGRMVERGNGKTYINCYNEEVFNQLDVGSVVRRFQSTIDDVSIACIDGANPTKESSYPNINVHQSLRFTNTCGRRYCRRQNDFANGSGYVTEISPNGGTFGARLVEVICYR